MRHLASVLSQAAHAAAEAAAKDDAYLELTEALTRAERSAVALSALLDENDDDLTAWPVDAADQWETATAELTEHATTAEILCRVEDAR